MNEVKIGLIGLGTVGVGVVKTLTQNGDLISKRLGLKVTLAKIADIDLESDRGISLESDILTKNAQEIIDDLDIDIVIELIGGIDKAKLFIENALNNKKHVVTANKALLCHHGKELFDLAIKNEVSLLYEASVAGGIPIIKAVEESFQANQIKSVYGIINGTANYILTSMAEKKLDFDIALKKASDKGYAEADPSLDIDGIDSAHKLVILASLCFDTWVDYKDLYIEGISHITAQDIKYADELGYTIKLLGIAKEDNGEVEVRVHPTFVPKDNLLAEVNKTFNAVLVEGNIVGQTLFYGKGAGQLPTASSVVSDVIDIAKRIKNDNVLSTGRYLNRSLKKIKAIDAIETKAYLKIMVEDKPGVLAKIASILGDHGISISSVIQKEESQIAEVPLVLMLHKAKTENINDALEKIKNLQIIRKEVVMIRVLGEE